MLIGFGAKVIDSNPHHDDDDDHIIYLSRISIIATQQKAKYPKYPKYPKYSAKYFQTFHEIVKKMMKKRKCSLVVYHLWFSAKSTCKVSVNSDLSFSSHFHLLAIP